MRIVETNPWSVTVMSFLFLGGLGAGALGSVLTASVVLDVLIPGAWPTPSVTLYVAAVVVTLEVFLGTALACLCSFMYNYTAQFSGGVEVALTDDPGGAAPAARALRLMTRLHTRVLQRLHARLPVDLTAAGRLSRLRHGDTLRPGAEAGRLPARRSLRSGLPPGQSGGGKTAADPSRAPLTPGLAGNRGDLDESGRRAKPPG
ncbi:DUF3566 domain-containing protein [Streptomyces sp. NRRL S-1022]|uniref:DUF3566 domain-containing protein n=1 Tax=Streptomyces sp. NRRL S-1022 TaxID=1463880 RepID=UPI0004C0237D|nr:DUF3566 domain-containing protein [Streptomyces sp. NRRL S-1022]